MRCPPSRVGPMTSRLPYLLLAVTGGADKVLQLGSHLRIDLGQSQDLQRRSCLDHAML
jgi:hypothetical protein